MLPFVFEDGFGYDRYVDYMLDVPMYFVFRDGKYIDAAGQSFRDFLKGELPALPGELPRLSDWTDHLSTAFPEVRLKSFLEMRGADGGPWNRICAAGLERLNDADTDLGIVQILAALAVHIQRDWHTPGPLAADDPVWTTFDHGTDAIFRTLRHPAGVLDGVASDAAQRRGVRKPQIGRAACRESVCRDG